MKYSDLLRSVSGYNGLSEKGRRITVKQHADSTIQFREKSHSELEVTMPTVHDRELTPEQASGIRSKLADVIGSFLYSGGIHSTIEEWKCNDSPLGGVTRAVDEVRSTTNLCDRMAGIKNDVRQATASSLESFASKASELGALDEEGERTLAALAAVESAKGITNGVPKNAIDSFCSSLPETVAAKVAKAIDDGVLSAVMDARTVDESVAAGKRVYEYFFDKSAEQEIQEQQEQAQQGEGGGEGEGQEGDGEGKSDGQDVMEKFGRSNEGGDKDPDKEASTEEGQRSEDDMDGEDFAIGSDGHGEYYITPPDEVDFVDYRSTAYREHRLRRFEADDVLKNNGALFAKVRRILQVRSEAYYVGGQKRGKLQRSKVYRVGCPTVGSGDWNSRIWRKRYESDTLDSAVEILVDFSGSMSGSKIVTAIEAAAQLAVVLDKLGIPVQVTSFTDRPASREQHGGVLRTGIFKHFDSPVSPQDLLDGMAYEARNLEANPDACAVHYAIRRVAARRERRKVLLVLSDGHPASQRMGCQEPILKEEIEGAARFGVECYGIGILSDAVEEFYPEYSVLQSVKELPSCLAAVIEAKIV